MVGHTLTHKHKKTPAAISLSNNLFAHFCGIRLAQLSRVCSLLVIPRMNTPSTTDSNYFRDTTKDGTVYRVRTNKRGVRIVPITLEVPEKTFLHYHDTRKGQTVRERMIEVLEAN
jgi:hypothetical protein